MLVVLHSTNKIQSSVVFMQLQRNQFARFSEEYLLLQTTFCYLINWLGKSVRNTNFKQAYSAASL